MRESESILIITIRCEFHAIFIILTHFTIRFKTFDGHQTHCRKQGSFKCEICHQLFCSNKAFLIHKQQHINDPIELIETKPTFVECSDDMSEPLETVTTQDELPTATMEHVEQGSQLVVEPIENEQQQQQPISISISSVGYDMAPFEIQMNMSRDLEPPLRNKFPSPNCIQDYHCYLCNRRFKKFPLLRYHMVVHTLPRKYKCQYCNSRFRTQRHYTSHQKNHVDYYCETCNKKFNSAFALKVSTKWEYQKKKNSSKTTIIMQLYEYSFIGSSANACRSQR